MESPLSLFHQLHFGSSQCLGGTSGSTRIRLPRRGLPRFNEATCFKLVFYCNRAPRKKIDSQYSCHSRLSQNGWTYASEFVRYPLHCTTRWHARSRRIYRRDVCYQRRLGRDTWFNPGEAMDSGMHLMKGWAEDAPLYLAMGDGAKRAPNETRGHSVGCTPCNNFCA